MGDGPVLLSVRLARVRRTGSGILTMQIGIYEVIELLGDGGMGSVYRCRDPRFDRQVALKVLHPHFQRNPDVVLRFKTEAVVQAKLSHPHIVTVYDFLADETGLAIVMELVEGHSAERLVETGGPLGLERGLRLFEQVLEAIGYAHDQGLVHRDIKPSNILIQQGGGPEIAKVVDFGIAKIVGSDRQKTATTAKLGTLAYMSPEQVRSPKEADVRSDVYSLGATLQQLLTGSLPFDGESDYEMMRAILEAAPAPPLLDGEPLPERVDRAIQKALLRDPDQRFQSCREFLGALRGAAIDLPASPDAPEYRRPEPPTEQARPEVAAAERRHERGRPTRSRSLIGGIAAALVGLVLVGAGTTMWRLYRDSVEEAALAVEKAKRTEEFATKEAHRIEAEAKARERKDRERRLREEAERKQRELEHRQQELERQEAERKERERRGEEQRRLAAARSAIEKANDSASAHLRRGDLEVAREELVAARGDVPVDLRADLDTQLSTSQELLLEIDRRLLEQEKARQAEEALKVARRRAFEDQLAVARDYLADRRFPEATTVAEKVLEQADLPSDLRSEAKELAAAARSGLEDAWEGGQVKEGTQHKKKPPNP